MSDLPCPARRQAACDRLDGPHVDGPFAWLGQPAEKREPTATLRRVLSRMRARRVVTAALYSHPVGTELRVYFEPEGAGDLLHSQVERFDVASLETKAEALRDVLREKGWLELPPEPTGGTSR
jgi:hypothetical protein